MVAEEELTVEEKIFHNDCISCFNQQLYSDIFTEENLHGRKKCITLAGKKYYGFFFEKGINQYFVLDIHAESMPFKIKKFIERDYKNDVFRFATDVQPVSIPASKNLTFRQLIDTAPNFTHTSPKHFQIYKILAYALAIDRVNCRVSSEAGFGKDSVVNIIAQLVDSTVNLYGATMAKLEYVLRNKLIILNELANLKKEEKIQMQEFFLAVGAYFNTYTKRSRKTDLTQEQYDISKLSLVLFYNLPSYYTSKGQEYFEQMFTGAVVNRFIPFVFDGRLTTRFDRIIDVAGVVKENEKVYKDVIATIKYYQQNPVTAIKYKVNRELIKFPKNLMRYDRSFNVFLKYIGEYCNSQEEFDDLSRELFLCYKRYEELIKEGTTIK